MRGIETDSLARLRLCHQGSQQSTCLMCSFRHRAKFTPQSRTIFLGEDIQATCTIKSLESNAGNHSAVSSATTVARTIATRGSTAGADASGAAAPKMAPVAWSSYPGPLFDKEKQQQAQRRDGIVGWSQRQRDNACVPQPPSHPSGPPLLTSASHHSTAARWTA